MAEQSHLICDIGRWVLTRSCLDRRRWAEASPLGLELEIAANISTAELLACEYVPMVESVLAETGTDPRLVTLEITENVLIKDPDRALVVLGDLKELGVRLALDDFGTGYSSLSYLHDFPVDIVKIDRSFVSELGRDAASDAIIDSIVNLAHTLAKTVIAEGVETLDQYRRVTALGCEACQGFYFARPQPAEAIGGLIDLSSAGDLTLPVAVPSAQGA